MKTIWGETLDPAHILPEYPRPQLRRDSYLNLNGPWEYAFAAGDAQPDRYDGTILVPFSPESELSGVCRGLTAGETLWYRRELVLPEGFLPEKGRALLHFGAVDQEARVFVNGQEMACHMGGYTAFTVDITPALQEKNTLVVRVRDDTDASFHSRGKQKTKKSGIWYTPQSGIWQTVWLEAVPENYVERLTIVPCLAQAQVTLTVHAVGTGPCTLTLSGASQTLRPGVPTAVPVADPHPWSPEDPFLYDFSVTFGQDRVESYFGLRDICVQADEQGVKRLLLNGKPYFHTGLLDQGYWPDGLYTAPSDEALIFDIETAKAMGFNLLRKHIKIEPLRWYYHCDRLGMLVWQDMVNGGGQYKPSTVIFPLVTGLHRNDRNYRAFAREAEEGRAEYLREMEETVRQLGNAPSLVLWVPFNEGWGQFDAAQVSQRLRAMDPSRPIDHASGWHDQGAGDFKSLHVYFKPYRFRKDRLHRAVILSEFGGYHLRMEGHASAQADFGYKRLRDAPALLTAYQRLYETQVLPAIPKGLCAAVYTQLADVEGEVNGLVTCDRKMVKLPVEAVRRLNERARNAGEV